MSKKLITTIIPTYRRPGTLRRAIASVLNQTYPDFRLCIYDNASGDETEAAVREIQGKDSRVEYVRRPTNIGRFANFIDSASRVETPYFSFLPDDDLLLPHFFEAALSGFRAHPAAALSILATLHITPRGYIRYAHILRWPKHGFLMPPEGGLCCMRHGNPGLMGILIRREIWEEFGGYDEATEPCSDAEFTHCVSALRPIVISRQPGAIQLMHERAATATADQICWVWPCIPRMIDKVRRMDLPPEAKREFLETLSRWLKEGLLLRVTQYAGRKRWGEAAIAADLLAQECEWESAAKVCRAVTTICREVPGVRLVLRMLLVGKLLVKTVANLELQWRWHTYSRLVRDSNPELLQPPALSFFRLSSRLRT